MSTTAKEHAPMYVERHAFGTQGMTALALETRARFESFSTDGAKPDRRRLVGLGRFAEEVMADASVLGRDDAIVWRAARTLGRAKAGLLALSAAPRGLAVVLTVGEHNVTWNAVGPASEAHIGAWQMAWYAALSVRDDETLEQLQSIPDHVLRASPTCGDDYQYAWKAALIAFRRQAPARAAELARAIRLTQPEHVEIATPEAAELQSAIYPVLGALIDGNEMAFQGAMLLALQAHKQFWGSPERAQSSLGWLAWPPLALACVANDLGWRVKVESEYLLPALVAGTPVAPA